MRIAVLAWGSLVWQPRNAHGEVLVAGPWRCDGPGLPVEFARISADGRLTLILVPDYPHRSQVLWAPSAFDDVASARENLARRETRAPIDMIHGVTNAGVPFGSPPSGIREVISVWSSNRSFDAVIWTGLGPGERWNRGFEANAAVEYVAGLSGEARRRAVEYIRRAPEQIDTPVRRALRSVV
jgi:hypothetical protein